MRFADPKNRFIKEVIENNEYGFLNNFQTVIDIGANIGSFSMWIYDQADVIYAIEPVRENVEELMRNIKLNNLDKIIVKEMAISNESKIKMMYKNGDPQSGGWKIDEAGDYPVDCRTLEDFMNSCNISCADLVKLDVEGEELKILQTPFFPKDRVKTIIGEYHNSSIMLHELKKTLEWLGYEYKDFGNNHFIARL